MKATVGALKTALAKVQKAVHTSSVTLQGIGEVLTIHASNGPQGSAKATLAVERPEDFLALVDGARLTAVLSGADITLPCEIKNTDEAIRFKFGQATIRLQKIKNDESLLLEDSRWNGAAPIGEAFKGADLKAAFERVTPFAARNDVRYYLNSVLMTERDGFLTLVGTDGFRLARLKTGLAVGSLSDVILPISIADALGSVLDAGSDVEICTVGGEDNRGIGFRSESFEVMCPVIQGKYPQFERVIPGDADLTAASVNRKSALAVLERIGAVAETGNGACYVRVHVKEGVFGVTTVDEKSRDHTDLADPAAVAMDMGFQPKLLAPALAGVKSELVRFMYTRPDDASPKAVIRDSEGDAWSVVVMPSKT
jgi:hypothetical protein